MNRKSFFRFIISCLCGVFVFYSPCGSARSYASGISVNDSIIEEVTVKEETDVASLEEIANVEDNETAGKTDVLPIEKIDKADNSVAISEALEEISLLRSSLMQEVSLMSANTEPSMVSVPFPDNLSYYYLFTSTDGNYYIYTTEVEEALSIIDVASGNNRMIVSESGKGKVYRVYQLSGAYWYCVISGNNYNNVKLSVSTYGSFTKISEGASFDYHLEVEGNGQNVGGSSGSGGDSGATSSDVNETNKLLSKIYSLFGSDEEYVDGETFRVSPADYFILKFLFEIEVLMLLMMGTMVLILFKRK